MLSRRRFVAWASVAVPFAVVARRADALGAAWITEDEAMLRALAECVLPSELGREGAARVARGFEKWILEYREQAELLHGYGTSALRFTRASPRAKWALQLAQMRAAGFLNQSMDARRDAVRVALKDERLDRMPDVSSAPHVAVGLLSFYYGSSEAADLCYRARIGKETCRPLADSPRQPLPLAGGGGRP